MVRAESVTATLVYTYNAAGLRVAQSVQSAPESVATFAWDWASGLPEMLATGNTLYLVGHETLGQYVGSAWTYYLPDALGSVRQATDGAGAVVSAREWSPYGVEAGGAQAGLGYTGEWYDAAVGLLYLRARWLDVATGRFTQADPSRMEQNLYLYARANPINLVDPSGLYTSDCECFAEEVGRFIALAKSHTLLGVQLDDGWVVQMLGGYYAGFRITQNVFGCSFAIPPGFIVRDPTPERWPTPGNLLWRVFDDPPVEGAEEEALSYGFKRIFYNNTHHYFANFYEAYFYGSTVARQHNNRREVRQYRDEGHPYYESAADILIAEVAIGHAQQALNTGIEALPQLLRQDACGDSLEEIYAEWVWPNPIVESWLGPPPQG